MTRHDAREQAFFVLFDKLFYKDETIASIIQIAEESELIKLNAFAETLLKTIEENSEAIDAIVDEKTPGWTLDRLPKVSLALLRLAVCEIKFFEETPVGVAINEAVEICKKYGTDEDAAYINGVLGAVARS